MTLVWLTPQQCRDDTLDICPTNQLGRCTQKGCHLRHLAAICYLLTDFALAQAVGVYALCWKRRSGLGCTAFKSGTLGFCCLQLSTGSKCFPVCYTRQRTNIMHAMQGSTAPGVELQAVKDLLFGSSICASLQSPHSSSQ